MKNCIVFFIVFKLTALSVAAQMPQSNWPKFIRWEGNAQIVLNKKIGKEAVAKDYIYDLITKKYNENMWAILKTIIYIH